MSESFYRRNLPHWEMPGATYFVTMCLAGSVPASGCFSPRRPETRSRQGRHGGRSRTLTPGQTFVAYDKRLDTSPQVRWFDDPRLARVAVDSLHWGVGSRYELIAYVVMPSHVHWVFTPLAVAATSGWKRRLAITAGFKSYTAVNCNRLLGRRGRFWQEESYDRVVRDADELERVVRYVEYNPVRAGLCSQAEEWEFSSAAGRASTGRRPVATERRGAAPPEP